MRAQGLPNGVKMESKSAQNATCFSHSFLGIISEGFCNLFEMIFVAFSAFSAEEYEIGEYVILSTALKREANSRGSKDPFFHQKVLPKPVWIHTDFRIDFLNEDHNNRSASVAAYVAYRAVTMGTGDGPHEKWMDRRAGLRASLRERMLSRQGVVCRGRTCRIRQADTTQQYPGQADRGCSRSE